MRFYIKLDELHKKIEKFQFARITTDPQWFPLTMAGCSRLPHVTGCICALAYSRQCIAHAHESTTRIECTDFVCYYCISESLLMRIELRVAQSTVQGLTTGPWKLLRVIWSYGFLYYQHGRICANILSDLSSTPTSGTEIFSSAQLSWNETDTCRDPSFIL